MMRPRHQLVFAPHTVADGLSTNKKDLKGLDKPAQSGGGGAKTQG